MTIKVDRHGLTVQASRPALSQTIAIGSSSAVSAAFSNGPTNTYAAGPIAGVPISTPNNTTHVRLAATADCWIAFGATPVAAVNGTASILLFAGVPEYFWVYPGEFIAVIQASAAGFLNIGELVS